MQALALVVLMGSGALGLGVVLGRPRISIEHVAGRVMIDLGDHPALGPVHAVLARKLSDPSLTVAYWLPERQSYVDRNGRSVALPDPGSGLTATILQIGEQPIAAVLHDSALEQDPELIEAAAAAARPAIEDERLQTQIRGQLEDVRRSRTRIVEGADAERRRIERNLHDGAQQSLVTLSLSLAMARAKIGTEDPDVEALLARAGDHIAAAIAELRDLARGVYPTILGEAGLGPALESLALRSRLRIQTGEVLTVRLPAQVETAAYFVVAQALAEAAQRSTEATVTVSTILEDRALTVELVETPGPSGAERADDVGFADRVSALGGTLVQSTLLDGAVRMLVTLPCHELPMTAARPARTA